MKFVERTICREEIDESSFGLLAFIFSDEYLATIFVLNQLKTWKTNQSYELVFIAETNLDLPSFIASVLGLLPFSLFSKINQHFDVKDAPNGGQVRDRMVCFFCKNIGSIISARTASNSGRFVCEKCHEKGTYGTQPISDLIWSRRCNEGSLSQLNYYSQTVKGIQSEIDKVLGDIFKVIPSMMVVKKDMEADIITLSSLFSQKRFRKEGFGNKLVNYIPTMGLSSVSICTAGLDSEYLFSKCIKCLYLFVSLIYYFIL